MPLIRGTARTVGNVGREIGAAPAAVLSPPPSRRRRTGVVRGLLLQVSAIGVVGGALAMLLGGYEPGEAISLARTSATSALNAHGGFLAGLLLGLALAVVTRVRWWALPARLLGWLVARERLQLAVVGAGALAVLLFY
jgi:uncharacterized membrane protein